jgi:DNA primase catalytic core
VRIDDGVKREVLARIDIGEFIGSFVPLRKRGNDLVGLCPFHSERTPSLHVHPDRGFFKCFGCGAGGDVITFYQRIDNLTFPEALRALAKRVGIEVQPENPAAARARSEKEAIYAANEIAAAFFHRELKLGAEASVARAYCEKRGIVVETIDAFKLGYAPASWDALERELAQAAIGPEVGERAGLLKRGQRGYYDFYRARLMIPTHATTGEVVAFGGRALDGSEPKYLNTSTTPVYTKGRGLFALNVARRAVAQSGALIVVEGYLDCIALHQAGFANAVASLGTSFTAEQANEIRKYVERAFVCFDADAAGSAATAKSIEILVTAGVAARIVQLPAGEDPDSFLRERGRDAFAKALDDAVPWIEFSLERAIGGIRTKFVGAAQVARHAEQLVRSLPREEWDRWRVYVAGRLGLSPDDLRASALRNNQANFEPRGAGFTRHASPAAEPPTIERDILATLLGEPALVAEYASRIPAERFATERYRALYEALCGRRGELRTPSDVLAALGDDAAAIETVVGLQAGERTTSVRFRDSAERRLHLDRIVERLEEEVDQKRMRELALRLDALVTAGEPVPETERDEYNQLVEKRERAARRRLATKPSRAPGGGESTVHGT